MNEQEQKDLDELKVKRADIQNLAFDTIRSILGSSVEELKHRGYLEHGEAVIDTFKYYSAKIDTLYKEYLKIYPD